MRRTAPIRRRPGLAILAVLATLVVANPALAQTGRDTAPRLLGDGFVLPSAVAYDAVRERIFVLETGRNAIAYASRADAIAAAGPWTRVGEVADRAAPEALSLPQGLAVDSAGNLYVADTFNSRAVRFGHDPGTDTYSYDPTFLAGASSAPEGIPIDRPRDVAVSVSGAIFLLDSGNARVLVADGPSVSAWRVAARGEWRDPRGLTVAPDGTLWIADTGNHQVVRIAPDGTQTEYGRFGRRRDAFRYPSDVAIDSAGTPHVLDTHNHRIVALAPDGTFARLRATGGFLRNPEQAVFMNDGEFLVADNERTTILAFLDTDTPRPYDGFLKKYLEDDGAEPSGASGAARYSGSGLLVSGDETLTVEDLTRRGFDRTGSVYPVEGEEYYLFVQLLNRGTQTLPPGTVRIFSTDDFDTSVPGNPFPENWSNEQTFSRPLDPTDAEPLSVLLVPEVPSANADGPGEVILGPLVWRPSASVDGCRRDVALLARHLNLFDPIEARSNLPLEQTLESNDVLVKLTPLRGSDCVSRRDRYEVNDTPEDAVAVTERWTHLSGRCPTRGDSHPPGCEGVFENGFAPRFAEEVFLMDVPDLTLHTRYDADAFRIELPDLADPAYGLNDIDSGPGVEQMPECGAVQRLDPGPGGADRQTYISISTTLVVEAIPSGPPENPLAFQPIGDSADKLLAYDPNGDFSTPLEDPDADSRKLRIVCPQEIENLEEIVLTFGERVSGGEGPGTPGARVESGIGGYRLGLSYVASMDRGFPPWATDPGITGGIREIPCIGAFAFRPGTGRGPLGPIGRFRGIDGASFPIGGRFPFCGDVGLGRIGSFVRHPLVPDCIADGPGCFSIHWFRWLESGSALDLVAIGARDVLIELIDQDGEVIAETQLSDDWSPEQWPALADVPLDKLQPGAGPNMPLLGGSLFAPGLSEGIYGLRVSGPATDLTLALKPPER